ncbi:KIR-like protein [Plasmodium coatneyi]|uniref:KIR-like protein n=1 Tax=Plasmodium coatneyi TaxID=208452 RepID=A0A1B1DT18_9APIC|nr:KIR-like protein [Plasmodium coatneyi]ANQ05892.1 KIR-like protein [Plasmodium coatneyi]
MSGVTFPPSLPSNNIYYDRFIKNARGSCTDYRGKLTTLETNLGTALNEKNGFSDKGKNIMDAYCKASKEKEEKSDDNTPCLFFYYWLGDTLYNGLTWKHHFQSNINSICKFINEAEWEIGCKITYKDEIDYGIFKQRKEIHDYSFNFNTIEKELLKNGPICEPKWLSHRSDVLTACTAVSEKCPEGGSKTTDDPYCKEFKDKYNFYCGMVKTLDSYCREKSKLEQLTKEKQEADEATSTAQSELSNAIHQANKASSLSSAFGTLALMELPALAYFLYKVKIQL